MIQTRLGAFWNECRKCLIIGCFSLQDLDAVAVSVEPGLTLSLKVGLDHAKKLAQTAKYVIYTFTRFGLKAHNIKWF